MYKRILNEILLSEIPSEGIHKLMDNGEMNNIIPELLRLKGFEQQTPYHDKDVLEHTLAVVDEIKPKLNLRLAALLHDISKPDCFTTLEWQSGLGFSKINDCYGRVKVADLLSLTLASPICLIWAEKAFRIRHLIFYDQKV